MTHFLHTDADLHKALTRLVKADPRLKPVLEKAGRPNLRRRPAGFPGLCAIVVSQQLSTSSARAIWGGWKPPSTLSIMTPCAAPAHRGSRGSASPRRRSGR